MTQSTSTERSIDPDQTHFVYIVQCADNSLYTGYTTNIERRIAAHNAGKGARYTRSHRPVTLLASWSFPTKSEAMHAEYTIKQLSRAHKWQLIVQAREDPLLSLWIGE